MRKFLTEILFLLLAASPALAQNNPFGLVDKCYDSYIAAERMVGKEGFREYNERLLMDAAETGDKKAQTLYYVLRLKDRTRVVNDRLRGSEDKILYSEEEERILEAMEDLKRVSRQNGFIQYYYYSYDLVENVYYNSGQILKMMDLVQEMLRFAEDNGEEYGVWMSNCYLVNLYVAQNDYVSAKKYIENAIHTFETATDSTILRQTVTRLYCDLADTYPIGHDSVEVNLLKAEAGRKQHLDTLRCLYYRAKQAAYKHDIPTYERNREVCKADPQISQISATYEILFDNIDKIVYGTLDSFSEEDLRLMESGRLREIKYIANIAENYGYNDLAFSLEKRLVAHHEQLLSQDNRARLSELDARLGNTILSAKVDEQTQQMLAASRRTSILIGVVFFLVLVFSWIYIFGLRRANEKVRLADAAKTRFVQNMSHEVRTPLNAIVGFSQLLSLPDGSFPEEEKEEFAGHIVNNTKMLTMLLDDILNASAMDSGNYSITYEEGEKNFMAEAAISSAEHRLQPGVKLYYDPEDSAPFTFTTDPRRVQQILINLITNACKHTTEGEIRVSSSLAEHPGYVSYSVTDTGPGIPPEQAEAIFERFKKLNEFVQGTGLGLSICRDIASRMGAKVYLDTSYTGGARFVFQIPINPAKTATQS